MRFILNELYQVNGKIMNRISALFAVVAALIAGGCSSPPPPRPAPLTENPRYYEHAEVLKNELAGIRTAAAFITPRMYENFRYSPAELADRLRKAGMTQAYLMSEGYEAKDFGDELAPFLAALKQAGIPVWVLLSDHIIYEKPQQSFIHLNVLARDYDKNLHRRVAEFSELDNVFGIALALTPHINNPLRQRNLYSWNENTYGIGNENDMLIRDSLKLAAAIRREHRSKPFALLVPGFYHAKAAAGELSAGRIRDYTAIADQVIVTAFAHTPAEQVDILRPQLEEAAAQGRQLIVCVLTDDHFSSRRFDSLSGGAFGEFIRKISTGLKNIRHEAGFGGIAFMNFRGVEILLEKAE